jgi:phenylacetate-CoA ligase
MRISPVVGRLNHMIKYKGTTLYPASVFDVLDHLDYVENYLVEVSSNEVGMDEVLVIIGSHIQGEDVVKELKDHFRAKLRVTPEIQFGNMDEIRKIQLPDMKRKPVKFIDKRK